jgi:hypothetical protein
VLEGLGLAKSRGGVAVSRKQAAFARHTLHARPFHTHALPVNPQQHNAHGSTATEAMPGSAQSSCLLLACSHARLVPRHGEVARPCASSARPAAQPQVHSHWSTALSPSTTTTGSRPVRPFRYKGKGQRASVGDPQPDDPFGQLARLQKEVPLPMRWSCWDSNPDLRLYRPLFYR